MLAERMNTRDRASREPRAHSLENKTALVTGAGSGIGRAIAIRFAQARGRVVVVDIAESAARDTVKEIEGLEGSAIAVTCDVAKQRQVDAAFREAAERFGDVDILVTSAG